VRLFSFLQSEVLRNPNPLRAAITIAYRKDESTAVEWLLSQIFYTPSFREKTQKLAHQLVTDLRKKHPLAFNANTLMHALSPKESAALMCLAEALLRIPDNQTTDRLIAEKITQNNWQQLPGRSPSWLVYATLFALRTSSKLLDTSRLHGLNLALFQYIAKASTPLIRTSVQLAIRMLGKQFVTGQTITEALKNSQCHVARGYRYSYDMLGEAALTADDAARYYDSYENAIHTIGRASNGLGIRHGPGISVKLSALHPRYARAQRARVMHELLPRIKQLILLAKQYNIGLTIDAEESDRLELSLDIMEALAFDADLCDFDGIGFALQAYQKRAPLVLDFLIDLAQRSHRKLMVRLVKGAYWDTEIKRAQVDGMSDYPVYTRKAYTDLSYLVCAQKLLVANKQIYPQFATHNAHTVAAIHTWAQQHKITDYEFQCLHGMGEALYDQVVGKDHLDLQCRIYAPVGLHKTLLPYLVRRLLENGANASFVHQIVDEKVSLEALIADPCELARKLGGAPHPEIPLPSNLFGKARKNSDGIDFSNDDVLRELAINLDQISQQQYLVTPLLDGDVSATKTQKLFNPADRYDMLGQVIEANASDVETALCAASTYTSQTMQSAERTHILHSLLCAADLLEVNRPELMALAIREAGKSLPNALAEVREAVDFCRYYATQSLDSPAALALGAVACISPWNFPLAIFIGQISAALAAGNAVLAKPAEQTPCIAYRAVQLLHEAGIPRAALQFLPGQGDIVGAQLTADARVQGVIFTGSTEVAQHINRTLTKRAQIEFCEIPLIAETGGQNAMIVDSSAHLEQVVQDVISSAFDSAGQRCSALRVLCLQEEIADKTLALLQGAMQQLRIANPACLVSDIGPVIDLQAQKNLLHYIEKMKVHTPYFFTLPLPADCSDGFFVAPSVLEINALSDLKDEVFGPVLHVLRYKRNRLSQLIDAINASGYGLTLGLHTRIDATVNLITKHAHVGNIYVNRNMIGAVVGVQPFGGEAKSGTGPKAGGPLYLKRLQRNPMVTIGNHHSHDLPRLNDLLIWAKNHEYQALINLIQGYAQNTLLGITMALPGPSGEDNTLSFAPRGRVLCVASTRSELLNQLAAILATDNIAVCIKSSSWLIPKSLPAAVCNNIQYIENSDINRSDFQMALVASTELLAIHPFFTASNGILVSILATTENDLIPLWRLMVERTFCVNTMATGGNAKFMYLDS
jgi:RHH-type proline utilization regulon transcriptional repressor/proline dehydrogenase/delta 1-pyrroline-5-carboxylate dehydrogenase